MGADPLAGDVTNPQSLNRYAYVLNNSPNLTDPSGAAPPCKKNCYPNHSSPFFVTCNHHNGGSANQRCDNTVNCFVTEAPIACGSLNSMFVDPFALVEISFNTFLVGYKTGPGAAGQCSGGLCTTSSSDVTVYATVSIASYANTGGQSWWWGTFARSFFKFSGDKSGKQLCILRFLQSVGDQLNPARPSGATAAEIGTRAAGGWR